MFALDLASEPVEKASELLGLLHRQSIRNGEHEKFWQRHAALSPESIGKALFTEEVLRFIRREIRRREGLLVDEEDLASAIHTMFSPEARERIGPMRVRRKKRSKETQRREDASAPGEPAAAPPALGAASGGEAARGASVEGKEA